MLKEDVLTIALPDLRVVQALVDVTYNRIGNPSDEYREEADQALRAVEASRYSSASITDAQALLALHAAPLPGRPS